MHTATLTAFFRRILICSGITIASKNQHVRTCTVHIHIYVLVQIYNVIYCSAGQSINRILWNGQVFLYGNRSCGSTTTPCHARFTNSNRFTKVNCLFYGPNSHWIHLVILGQTLAKSTSMALLPRISAIELKTITVQNQPILLSLDTFQRKVM